MIKVRRRQIAERRNASRVARVTASLLVGLLVGFGVVVLPFVATAQKRDARADTGVLDDADAGIDDAAASDPTTLHLREVAGDIRALLVSRRRNSLSI